MSPINFAASLACSTGSVVVDGAQTVLGDDIKPNPSSMRSLLLSMEGSVHGRIRMILGDDEQEQVATMVRFLRGADQEELNALMGLVQVAIAEVNANP